MLIDDKTWIVVDRAGLIVAASVAIEGNDHDAIAFLMPIRKGNRLVQVTGPVRMGAHIDAPMVYPPVPIQSDDFCLTP